MRKFKESTYDVIDIYYKFKNDCPYLEFVIDEVERFVGKNKYLYQRFCLRKYNEQLYDPPLKTTILILINSEISEKKYKTILENVKTFLPEIPKTHDKSK